MRRNYWFIVMGSLWTAIFSGMSFYWAMGGLIGVRSLGGAIYEMALSPSRSFIVLVWFTGFIKLIGLLLLLMLLIRWKNSIMNKILYYTTKVVGILLFLYGFLNFITITLSTFNMLALDLDAYTTFWRLVFWEPYWMAGGIFYFFSVKRIENSLEKKEASIDLK
ncbi:DUF3995 domain-containing protein [Bacillus sp. REN10]|uniref:DUF3995 domain-containing protein n=1 Tax=Bacillus sp. REN10 TaxID=2782541 RepID=UPI00193BB8E4|nr:DUF3995 domain-containing protein [Bacillus sp. REN10]